MAQPMFQPTVMVWWDLDTVKGSVDQVTQFPHHLKDGIRERFNLDAQTRFRMTVMHSYDTLTDSLRRNLPQDADVLSVTQDNTMESVLARKCADLTQDWRPNEVLLWIVSTNRVVGNLLQRLHQKQYHVFLVSDFDYLSKDITNLSWLEVYNYYVIARGDKRKLLGRTPKPIRNPFVGFARPVVLTDLRPRQERETAPWHSSEDWRVIAPPSSAPTTSCHLSFYTTPWPGHQLVSTDSH